MIRASSVKKEGEPYLTKIEDEKGRSITIDSSSRKNPDLLSPSQLVQAGLAGCLSMTVKGALFRAGLSYEDVIVTVEMEEEDGKYTFTYEIDVKSSEDPLRVKEVTDKAASGCYVRGILSSGPTVKEKA